MLPSSFVTPPALEPPDEPLLVVDPEPESLESMPPPSKPSLEPSDAPEEQDASRQAANIGAKRTMEGSPVMARTPDELAVAIAVRPAPSEPTPQRRHSAVYSHSAGAAPALRCALHSRCGTAVAGARARRSASAVAGATSAERTAVAGAPIRGAASGARAAIDTVVVSVRSASVHGAGVRLVVRSRSLEPPPVEVEEVAAPEPVNFRNRSWTPVVLVTRTTSWSRSARRRSPRRRRSQSSCR